MIGLLALIAVTILLAAPIAYDAWRDHHRRTCPTCRRGRP